jgi:hypothetical protein
MNDLPDPLETELSSLMPCELSAKSQHRIAERLTLPGSSNRSRLIKQMAFVGSLAAACLIAAILWRQGHKPSEPRPEIVDSPKPIKVETGQRTLLAYHHSLSSFSENLDAEFSTFAWPLPETAPKRIASAIPADLLD